MATDSSRASPWSGRVNAAPLLAALVAAFCLEAGAAEPAATGTPELGSYELTVNTRRVDGAVLAARTAEGRLLLEESVVRSWRMRSHDMPRTMVDGLAMLSIDALPGTLHRFDERRQSIDLTIAPEHLRGTAFDVRASLATPVAQAPDWGGFLNWSLFGYAGSGQSEAAAVMEAGVFGPLGTGLASFGANTATLGGTTRELVRFDTSWRRDDPASMRTLVMGDTVSRAGFYGRPVRFAGIQYGSNFTLQPGYITTPLVGFSGTAAVPSTVDVFVNNQRVASQRVEPGPFTVTNVPSVTGSGTAQVIVRDAFGQQQVLEQALYGSPVLLAPGLDDFAVGIGVQRENYGVSSFDYGSPQASGMWRRGLSAGLTVEGRAEADSRTRSAGVAADLLVGRLGIASFGAAASSGDAGSGHVGIAGFSHQGRRFSAGVRGTFASEAFRQVGDDALFVTPSRSIAASAALSLGAWGGVGAALVSQRFHDAARPSIDTGTVTYSTRLGSLGVLTLSVNHIASTRDDTTVFAAFSLPLGDRGVNAFASTASGLSGGSDRDRQTVSLQAPAPAYGEGVGYSLYADTDERVQAGATWKGRAAQVRGELAESRGSTAGRVAIDGGIGRLRGHTFLTRPIVDSFAVVSTRGAPGLDVYQENQRIGRTDEAGLLVLTPLRAYSPNNLSIDPMTAPVGVAVGTHRQRVVPMWRSGIAVDFDVQRGRSALVRLETDAGVPLPLHASVVDMGSGQALPIGFDGEVFVTGLPDGGTRLRVELDGVGCTIAVVPEGEDAVLELGPYRCTGALR